MPWLRPKDAPMGQVWRRFRGRERHGVPARNYVVKDVEVKDKTKCLDLLQETFLRDEPLCQVLGILSDPVSVATIRSNWEFFLEHRVSLACFAENERGEPAELVAFNVCLVMSRDDEVEDLYQVKGEPWKKLLQTLEATEATCNVFDKYEVDQYLTCSGMTVSSEHRGQNIAAEMLRARQPLCKAMGLNATASVFTAIPAQVAAERGGLHLLGELQYSSMLRHGIDLSASDTPSAKLMGVFYK